MARRHYSSTAARTTLASGVDDSTTTLSVVAVSGWPASYPYTLILDQDTVNEEIVEVSARSGTTLTVTRGVDGTSATAHDAGAAVNHGVSARDFDEPNEFINGTGVVTEGMLASDSVTSAKIADGTIVNADINASAAIAQSKVADLTDDLAGKVSYSYGTATPTTDVEGFVWFDENDTPATPKYWDGTEFVPFPSGAGDAVISSPAATGQYTDSGTTYDYYTFTSSGTLTVDTEGFADVLVVGGGGGAGTGQNNKSGGGGGGGVLEVTDAYLPAGSLTVTVGAGATGFKPAATETTGAGTSGGPSRVGSYVSPGGGSGGGTSYAVPFAAVTQITGGFGGSGGGRNGVGLSGLGNNGADYGGGGAGSAASGNTGGSARTVTITGSSLSVGAGGTGGNAGGGNGGANSGKGGNGASGTAAGGGGNGGSGIVVIRVKV